MYYYQSFIIPLVILALGIWGIFGKNKQYKSTAWSVVAAIALVVISLIMAGERRDIRNIRHYWNILNASEITASEFPDGTEKPVTKPAGDFVLYNVPSDAPTYAKSEDIIPLYTLQFLDENGKRITSMQLCKLSDTGRYPEAARYSWHGNSYCFLSQQFLYENVFYYLPEAYAQDLIQQLLP